MKISILAALAAALVALALPALIMPAAAQSRTVKSAAGMKKHSTIMHRSRGGRMAGARTF